jgi:hypothetical protein
MKDCAGFYCLFNKSKICFSCLIWSILILLSSDSFGIRFKAKSFLFETMRVTGPYLPCPNTSPVSVYSNFVLYTWDKLCLSLFLLTFDFATGDSDGCARFFFRLYLCSFSQHKCGYFSATEAFVFGWCGLYFTFVNSYRRLSRLGLLRYMFVCVFNWSWTF